MHFLRDLQISSGQVPVYGAQAIQRLQEIHVSTREHIVHAGYGYFVEVPPHIFNDAPFDAPEVQDQRPNVRRRKGNVQGEPGRGGRSMRAINQAEQAEANQHRHDADDDDGGFEDVNALAIVPVPYRADEQNCEPHAFTSGVEIGGSSHSTAWEQSTSSCPSTTYCYPHSQGSFGELPSQGGMPNSDEFLDVQEPQQPQQLRKSTRITFPTHCGTHPCQRYP
nr:hypothetical protein Iba_chr07fCG6050 [Ipomoea batatas]